MKTKTIELQKENTELKEKYDTAVKRAQALNDRLEAYQKIEIDLQTRNATLKVEAQIMSDKLSVSEFQYNQALEMAKCLKAELRGTHLKNPKKKIDIFNPSNWFIKDEEIEDKIKEAKAEYDRLINETPIKRLSIEQIRDYVNKNYFGKF